jgi:hypothetical protein
MSVGAVAARWFGEDEAQQPMESLSTTAWRDSIFTPSCGTGGQRVSQRGEEDEWDAAWELVFSELAKTRWILMLRVYCDASNTHAGTKQICLAGFLAPLGKWQAFKYRWNRVLALSGIDIFHMADFTAAKAEPYRSWNDRKRRAVLESLVEIITETAQASIACLLDRHAFAVTKAAGGIKISSEYEVCANVMIGAVSHFLRQILRSPESVAYVFEAGSDGSARCVRAINDFMGRSDFGDIARVNSVHSERKTNAVGLQAADILAHTIARQTRLKQIPAEPLRSLVEGIPFIYRYVDDAALAIIARENEPGKIGANLQSVRYRGRRLRKGPK